MKKKASFYFFVDVEKPYRMSSGFYLLDNENKLILTRILKSDSHEFDGRDYATEAFTKAVNDAISLADTIRKAAQTDIEFYWRMN